MSSSGQTRLGGRTWYWRVLLTLLLVVIAAGLFGRTWVSGVVHASGLGPNGEGTPPVSFQGGWIQTDPVVYLVFWGPAWNTNMGNITTQTQIEDTFSMLAGSQYNNILRQYTNPDDTSNPDDFVHNNVRLGGVVVDNSPPPSIPLDIGVDFGGVIAVGSGYIMDEVNYALNSLFPAEGITPQISTNTQVIVFPQQGTTYVFPSACGMHSEDSSTGINGVTYSYVRWSDSGSGCNVVPDNNGAYGTSLSIARSTAWHAVHEYAETVTDPNIYATLNPLSPTTINGSGWNTHQSSPTLFTPLEIADICEGYTPSSKNWANLFPNYTDTHTGTAWYLPLLWSNHDSACVSTEGTESQSPDFGSPYTGKHTVQGAINTKYQSMGGTSSILGEPITEESPIAGGFVSYFAGQNYGGGYPLPSSLTSEFGGAGLTAGSGIYYHSGDGTHEVQGYIFALYNSLGGPTGSMGFPVTDEMATPDGKGRVSYFSGHGCGSNSSHLYNSGSAIYWNDGLASYVWGCNYNRYMGTCVMEHTACYNGNALGDPVTSEIDLNARGTSAAVNYFAGQVCNGGFGLLGSGTPIVRAGSGIYTMSYGTYVVQGCIFTKYTNLTGPYSFLGYPTSDETPLNGGSVSTFQGANCQTYGSYGQIYYSPVGTFEVHGCIDWGYLNMGGYNALGFPTSDQFTNSCGHAESDFQYARLIWAGGVVTEYPFGSGC